MEKRHYHVVCAVITKGHEVLCMQKGTTRYAYTSHHWEFPGGKTEPGESEPQALARELMEEMELPIRVGDHIISVDHEYPDFSLTLSAYHCQPLSSTFKLKEHKSYCWMPSDRLNELDWCAADAPILEKLKDSQQ